MKLIPAKHIEVSGRQQPAYAGHGARFKIGNEEIIIVARNSRALLKVAKALLKCEVAADKFKPTLVIEPQA